MLLLEGTAFFPSVATLEAGDPLEGDLVFDPMWLVTKLDEICGQNPDSLDAWLEANAHPREKCLLEDNRNYPLLRTKLLADVFVRELRKRRAVWCWFQSDHESAAMWSIYANAGVAVKTYAGELKGSLPTVCDFQVERIKYAHRTDTSSPSYLNPETGSNQDLILRPHLIKGIEYQHEHEVRVVTTCLPYEKGRLVKGIAVAKLVKEVVLSPLLPFEEAKAIEFVIQKHRWESTVPSVRRSSILGHIAESQEDKALIREGLIERYQPTEPDLPFPLKEL